MPLSEPHPKNCTCGECLPRPSYWNGGSREKYDDEFRRRIAADRNNTPYDGDAACANDP